jgi:uncharacterized protein (TIGR02246 family)
MIHFKFAAICIALSCLVIGCNNSGTDKVDTANETPAAEHMPAKPDLAKIKTDIQELENAWADADNARDTNKVAAFYADDAVSLSNNKPMSVGKAAIRQDIAASLAKRAKGSTVSYNVLDVFGDENMATEVGKTTIMDVSGKVTYTGKYMAVWEKRNGKYICIRDINNDDVKEK